MKLAQKTEINEDVITVSLNVEELGDSIRAVSYTHLTLPTKA